MKFHYVLKNSIKAIIKYTCGKRISGLKIPENVRIVSFDLFDTLVLRKVGNYRNVFLKVEEKYESLYGERCSFKELRIQAEQEARKHSGKREISFDRIYSELLELSGYSEKLIEILRNLELEVEIETCIPNEEMIDALKRALSMGCDVIIVSDMYLDTDFLKKILEKCDIRGYLRLYVSSANGKTKRHGDLFKYILDDLHVNTREIIHIGDNPIGDYLIPKINKMNSFLYRAEMEIV